MELRKISDRMYYLPAEEETDRPVLGYIKGDKYSLAIDAGNSSKHVEKFASSILYDFAWRYINASFHFCFLLLY